VRLTIDTSVFVSRLRETDASHAVSRRFLQALVGRPVIVILPTLVYPEVAGAMRRFTGDPAFARASMRALDLLPNLNIIAVDDRVADEATSIAVAGGMKGADAVFAAVANLFDATLVSLDIEQRVRCPESVRALTPDEAGDEVEAMK
jgi:predicted nucleic acid-binding protein